MELILQTDLFHKGKEGRDQLIHIPVRPNTMAIETPGGIDRMHLGIQG